MYQHKNRSGQTIDLPAGKVVCVGRNYADHVAELNNPLPEQPLLFMKPVTSLCHAEDTITLPSDQGSCHNELELALLIEQRIDSRTDSESMLTHVYGIGLALDLTLRDVQTRLKQQGLPWERAKSFDRACPLSPFVQLSEIDDVSDINFSLLLNQRLQQQGQARLMLWDPVSLLQQIAECFTLLPGDVVLTGTPKGVTSLAHGDQLNIMMGNRANQNCYLSVQTQVSKGG